MDNISLAKGLFAGSAGRWATAQLKKAFNEGRALTSQALRTLDTLNHEEWKVFDKAVIQESTIRLVGVADLIASGLVKPIPNSLGKMVFGWETETQFDAASVSLDGRSRTPDDVTELKLNQMPLPITHKDFNLNLRQLSASRNSGEALDTTRARQAGRVVAEKLEYLLFRGGPTFGGMHIYGYTNHPDRNTDTFDGGKSWDDGTKVGSSFLADVKNMIGKAQADGFYGPYTIYVPTLAGVNLSSDYNAGTANAQTIRQRLLAVDGITAIRVADQLTAANVIMKQDSEDVAVWAQGEPLQIVQWDEEGGFDLNFKAWAIGVPLIRSTAAGKSGIVHLA
jgi:uncharacterized linocin/CFP29 family protein